jgi:hypothetical protein
MKTADITMVSLVLAGALFYLLTVHAHCNAVAWVHYCNIDLMLLDLTIQLEVFVEVNKIDVFVEVNKTRSY